MTTNCQPTAGGPYSVLEGDPITVSVKCSTALEIPAELSIDPLPAGAVWDARTATLSWTPALDQAAVYELTLRASPWNEIGKLKIAVADRFDAAGNVPVRDPAKYTEEFGLPVLHVTVDPTLNDDAYTPATIVYRGHSYVGAEAKYRGTFSATYPKRSYTLKFTKLDKFADPNAAGGFLDKRKVTVITSFDDNSYLRQRLSFDLWNSLGPTQIKVQSYSAVLYLNGEYYGLYTIADHVDEYLMEDHGLSQAGNLYKTRSVDANFRATNPVDPNDSSGSTAKNNAHDGYTKEEGMPVEGQPYAYQDLDEFLTWINGMSAADFSSQFDTRAQRSDYENWWILVTYNTADDTLSKNSYHYHDPALTNGLWRSLPWDFNESFGQDWQTIRLSADENPEAYPFQANGLFERLFNDAAHGPALRARYGSLLKTTLSAASVIQRVDAMAQEITPSAHRDEHKWQSIYRNFSIWQSRQDFTTYDQEVQYLRQWITARAAYLSTRYP